MTEQQVKYPTSALEEELKNRVAADWFDGYDTTRILSKVDFCVAQPPSPLFPDEVESLLWAEAKKGTKADIYASFVQLILTIGRERTAEKYLPPKFLGAFDARQFAFLPYGDIMEVFAENDFNWNVTPSDHETREFKRLYARVKAVLDGTVLRFDYLRDEADLRRFIRANFTSAPDDIRRIRITKNNFTHIYRKWREAVMPSIAMPDWDAAKRNGILDADFFLADLLSAHDLSLAHRLNVLLQNDRYRKAAGKDFMGFTLFSEIGFNDRQVAHRQFWNRYRRPPQKDYWDFIVNRRDLLVPQDVRERKGSFFTPARWVELSQDYLRRELGDDWQEQYYVWDCCAGTGNLLAGLTNKYRIWASTLDQQDVDVIHERIKMMNDASKDNLGSNLLDSHVFQFDFLNDPFDRLPADLRRILDNPEERKKLVIYINPPYAEVSSKTATGDLPKGKKGVNLSYVHEKYQELLGTAGRELFTQFLIRISQELTGCKIGLFSKTKILQGSAFDLFRANFASEIKSLFVVPANTFDNVRGIFPIAFQVWSTGVGDTFNSIEADVYDAAGNPLGRKTFAKVDKSNYINAWISQFKTKDVKRSIGFMDGINGNDFQHNNIVYILNSKSQLPNPRGIWVTAVNLHAVAVYLTVRHVIEATWLNDRDQFLYPSDGWATDLDFQTDCLVYALFSGQNRISLRDGANHWIPFTEAEVGAQDAFQSHFMSDYLAGRIRPSDAPANLAQSDLFSFVAAENAANSGQDYSASAATPRDHLTPAARAVLDAGRELWRYYHAQPGANPDASFYDIRLRFQGVKTLPSGKTQMNPDSADATYVRLLAALRAAHRALADQIAPKVYAYGFLRR